jgi:hypothetical protein
MKYSFLCNGPVNGVMLPDMHLAKVLNSDSFALKDDKSCLVWQWVVC